MADQGAVAHATIPAHLHAARVTDVRHYTDGLFAFRTERPASLRFRSGEFVMMGLMVDGRPLVRAYSIASPAWDESLAFYSIVAPDGPLTSRLKSITPGQHVLIGRKPTGTLVLDALRPGGRLYMISTGTGLAPFASLIRDPETYERFDEVVLTHTCREAEELAFGHEVVAAAFADPLVGEEAQAKLRHVTSLTRAPHPLTGRITNLIADGQFFQALDRPPFDPSADRVMICGSVAMLADMKALALAAGLQEGSNHSPAEFVVERAFAG
jgi:ferredoxin/flavodoxin---NADP+ reductase